jgi:hypothetical protein
MVKTTATCLRPKHGKQAFTSDMDYHQWCGKCRLQVGAGILEPPEPIRGCYGTPMDCPYHPTASRSTEANAFRAVV